MVARLRFDNDLAAAIKREHKLHLEAARQSLKHAIAAGKLLLKAKAKHGRHGKWMSWRKKNIRHIPERTCSHYMLLARNEAKVLAKSATVADLTVRAAMAAVGKTPSYEWYTPAKYVEAARRVLGVIDLDPASCAEANKVVKAGKFFTKDDDGLQQQWRGRVWMNPPYCGKAGDFVTKLIAEYEAGNVTAAIVLVNAYSSDGEWFQPLWNAALCFSNHRIRFYQQNLSLNSTPNGALFAYFGPDRDAFAHEFRDIGAVLIRYETRKAKLLAAA
jgi:hypothetical protein